MVDIGWTIPLLDPKIDRGLFAAIALNLVLAASNGMVDVGWTIPLLDPKIDRGLFAAIALNLVLNSLSLV